ncbi:medium-chain acyl-CoA ligase ACSF2, mitochondrial-like isoform X3 [Salvelinus fontinalis]|uniref:medium-chain acyl-CoA ligase ACSF2, mitochondrial-like isoform X3 n=1 Tax=Salvelinus fontinalis TaxID=8038 RepID=UPI00248619F9|nr:medium-chain acyl-CoA ligase ACSF2, mitochondrial-like isoform X3 [Salvelinus fontinalis]
MSTHHPRQLSVFPRRAVLQPLQVVSSLHKTPGNPTWLWCCRSLHVDSPPLIPGQSVSYVHGASSVALLGQTVGQSLQAAADRWPHREALVFLQDGVRKTFSQFQEDVDQAAAGLLALGLKRGDRLGVWGPNTYHWILFQFATAKAGIILVSINPAYQLKELEYTLGKVQCKAVVCPTQFKTQRFCDTLRQICPEMDTAESGVFRSSRHTQPMVGPQDKELSGTNGTWTPGLIRTTQDPDRPIGRPDSQIYLLCLLSI